MSTDTIDIEAEISGLLDELTSVQSEMLRVLGEKRNALITANIKRLAELQPEEERLVSRLGECQDRRTALLATAKEQGQPGESVAKLVKKAGNGKSNNLG